MLSCAGTASSFLLVNVDLDQVQINVLVEVELLFELVQCKRDNVALGDFY